MEARATARTVLLVPRKARLVTRLIQGKSIAEASAILENMNKKSARLIKKVLVSATANAENNLGMNKANLYVAEAYADGAATLKRFQPVSKGRAHSIKKRTSHITIILDEKKA